MQKKKNFQEEAILITSDDQITELKKEYSQSQKVKFICQDCGKEFETILKLTDSMKPFCMVCKRKHTNLIKYGTPTPGQSAQVKAKAKATCLKRYGTTSSLLNKEVKQKAADTCMKKYGVDNVFKSKAFQDKAKASIQEKFGVDNVSKSKDIKEKKQATMLEHYGVAFPTQSSKIKEKIKQSCLESLGVDNPAKSKAVQQSIKNTCIEKYGVDNPQKNENVKSKTKQTCMDKYGFQSYLTSATYKKAMADKYGYSYAMQNSILREKAKKTSRKNYGTDYPMQNKELQNQIWATCAEKYGMPFIISSEKNRKKAISSCISKYGVPNAFMNKEIHQKAFASSRKKTMEKYGVPFFFQAPEFRKILLERYGVAHPIAPKFEYAKASLDSSWELYFLLYQLGNGHIVERPKTPISYFFEGKEHFYYPDFEVDGKLYEVKGDQFFKGDGTMQNPFDHSQDALFEAKHQCMVRNNTVILTGKDIQPMIDWVDSKFSPDFVPLFRKDIPFPYPTQIQKRDDILRVYHKSIWAAHRGNCKSPLEAWNDKELVLKSALNRLKYVGHCTPEDVRNGFNIAKIAPKVSMFSVGRAEYFIKKYLSSFDTIFDPFSGFSGRMLGSVGLKKTYIGQDINADHVRESNEIIHDFKMEGASVVQADVLKSTGSYPCLFTCSPYGGKEHWNRLNDTVELSCDEWIDVCLENFKCSRYLFVVDTTDKYKDSIVETLANKSHFGTKLEYVVCIDR